MPSSPATLRGAPKGTRSIHRAPVGSCVLSPAAPKPADPQLCGAWTPQTPEGPPPCMTSPRSPPPHPALLRASDSEAGGRADFPEALSPHLDTAAPGSWPWTRARPPCGQSPRRSAPGRKRCRGRMAWPPCAAAGTRGGVAVGSPPPPQCRRVNVAQPPGPRPARRQTPHLPGTEGGPAAVLGQAVDLFHAPHSGDPGLGH